jgi:hypothetical protein
MPVADVEPREAGGFGSVEAALGVGLAGRRQVGQQEIRPEGHQAVQQLGMHAAVGLPANPQYPPAVLRGRRF